MITEKIPHKFVLPLIAASSVLRKEKIFNELLLLGKQKKIPAAKIYEVLLQSYLFAGFPSALISLKSFNKVFPSFISINKKKSALEIRKRGIETCQKIYGDKFDKLIENVSSFSPELADWLITEGYGKVLSRENLSLQERELAIICILTVLKFEDQLYSHINGAFRLGIKQSLMYDLFETLKIFGINHSNFGKKNIERFIKRKSF